MSAEWIPVIVAAVAAVGSAVAAWISGRAGARKALDALTSAARKLEERQGETDAAIRRLRADFERHVGDETRARSRRQEASRQRDEALAAKLDALAGDVREQGTVLNLMLDGRVDTQGGRRGRSEGP